MMLAHCSDNDDDDGNHDDDDDEGDSDSAVPIKGAYCTVYAFFSDRRFQVENSLTRRHWTRPPQAEDNSINQLSSSYHLPGHAGVASMSSDLERHSGVPGGYPPWQQAPRDGSTLAQETAGPSTGISS